ncbi:hypothetical protein DFH06DRAFT_1464163 [Mycena polygramma]|nr:hypothetical protein DFH06DRAFT_1464163 [Mycena polygramma]
MSEPELTSFFLPPPSPRRPPLSVPLSLLAPTITPSPPTGACPGLARCVASPTDHTSRRSLWYSRGDVDQRQRSIVHFSLRNRILASSASHTLRRGRGCGLWWLLSPVRTSRSLLILSLILRARFPLRNRPPRGSLQGFAGPRRRSRLQHTILLIARWYHSARYSPDCSSSRNRPPLGTRRATLCID